METPWSLLLVASTASLPTKDRAVSVVIHSEWCALSLLILLSVWEYRNGLYSHKLIHRYIHICHLYKGILQSWVSLKARTKIINLKSVVFKILQVERNHESRKQRRIFDLLILHFEEHYCHYAKIISGKHHLPPLENILAGGTLMDFIQFWESGCACKIWRGAFIQNRPASDTRIESNHPGILIVSQGCMEFRDGCSVFTRKNSMFSIKGGCTQNAVHSRFTLQFPLFTLNASERFACNIRAAR